MKRCLLLLLILPAIISTNQVLAQQDFTGTKYHFLAAGWNGSTWLIAGMVVPDRVAFMATYDGEEFAPVVPPARELWVEEISWNGSEWIIKEKVKVRGSKKRVYAYDGREFRVVGTWEKREEGVYTECNEEYCLVWNRSAQRLLRCATGECRDVTPKSGIQAPHEEVTLMRWNGKYWLIAIASSEGGGVLRYDGKNFIRVRLPTPTAPAAMEWNGEYWLIGTLASPRFSGVLVTYDGYAVRDLTPDLLRWVVGKGASMLEKSQAEKKERPEENLTGQEVPEPAKRVCGPAAVLLLIAVPLLLRRLKS